MGRGFEEISAISVMELFILRGKRRYREDMMASRWHRH
jgi:hypothetical protein